jgi:hypothetical protein
MKFTTYIRKSTHLGVKTRLVSKEKELSDLVEELLSRLAEGKRLDRRLMTWNRKRVQARMQES